MAPTKSFVGQKPLQGHTVRSSWLFSLSIPVHLLLILTFIKPRLLTCTILSTYVCFMLPCDLIQVMRLGQNSRRSDTVSFSAPLIRRQVWAVCTIPGDVNIPYCLIKLIVRLLYRIVNKLLWSCPSLFWSRGL